MNRIARTLPRAASYWTAAAVAAIALWTSGAPSTTYPLYEAQWHVTAAITTTIFAVYPLTLVIVLLVFGDLADHIGRRAAILLGLAAMLIGTLLFAVAPNIALVFVGRAFMGVGVGLALSPASAAVVEFSRPGRERSAGSVTTASTALGLVFATLIGGALIQYAPFPLHLDFWVLVIAIAAVGVGVWFLPRHTPDESRGPWRPRGVAVAPSIRLLYVVAALAVSVAYMFGSVFLALGAQIAEEITATRNVFVVGAILAIMSAIIGVTAIATRSVRPQLLIAIGSVVTLVAFGFLLDSAFSGSLQVFMVTTLVSGAAYALMFAGGLGLIGQNAPAHHRAGTISAVYLVAYILQGAAAIALGLVATASGLRTALELGAVVVSVFAIAALVATQVLRVRDRVEQRVTDAAVPVSALEE
ncbi:MFS transporter [Gryllotalpicola protaetiae]|uniref:MFS transporter n=1 Tax=Gryllotalpicola protaetiae TaxID=2419771 RepID=A0A387BYS4_9MICO|nr:MFS transporter [Gryllotalpicola protaetiae]AYG03491.1 MFS transporter [Gryllotalpicola protaetiae]